MKISKALLGAIGVGVIACLLIAGTILVLHQPILQKNGWNGVQWVSTTTPTSTFFPPAPGWSKYLLETPLLPTRAAMPPFTTWTPFPTWSPIPSWILSPEGASPLEGTPSDTPTPQP